MLKKNEKILADCLNISSGTISSIINKNSYENINKFQNELVEFVLISNVIFLSWMDALNTFLMKKNNNNLEVI